MDSLSLNQRPTASAADTSHKSPASVPAPAGSELTQTARAVQAADKAQGATPSGEQLEKMAEQMETFIGTFNRGLQFRVDENSGRNVVTVVDTDSGDIIRQIPTEELLQVINRLAEASSGLIDTKAHSALEQRAWEKQRGRSQTAGRGLGLSHSEFCGCHRGR
ncbi:flagellar protein FlaG [Oceanimonas sp. NS1]|nr:flagellar protein FlaG [Oceanimonas sp. NS1]